MRALCGVAFLLWITNALIHRVPVLSKYKFETTKGVVYVDPSHLRVPDLINCAFDFLDKQSGDAVLAFLYDAEYATCYTFRGQQIVAEAYMYGYWVPNGD